MRHAGSRLFTIIAILGCFPVVVRASECPAFLDADRAKIIAYLAKWMDVEQVSIENDELVPGTCYRKLSINGRPFFLSADQRFLSGSLLDTTIDPEQKRRAAHEEINKILLSDPSPIRGPSAAAVTIVEFGDFECSFCKRLYEWTQLLVSEDAAIRFRIVFKHLPLHGHVWAHDAAALAICADSQSTDAFWQLHDFFFTNQQTLNEVNLEERVRKYVTGLPEIDGARLLSCVRDGEADAKIARDEEVASQFKISATPSIFINGSRVGVLQSKDDLRNLLKRAQSLTYKEIK